MRCKLNRRREHGSRDGAHSSASRKRAHEALASLLLVLDDRCAIDTAKIVTENGEREGEDHNAADHG